MNDRVEFGNYLLKNFEVVNAYTEKRWRNNDSGKKYTTKEVWDLFVKDMTTEDNPISLPDILFKEFEDIFNVTKEELIGPSRTEPLIFYRHVFCYLMMNTRGYQKYSLKAVGNIIGNRDHTTIINSCKVIIDTATDPSDKAHFMREILIKIKLKL